MGGHANVVNTVVNKAVNASSTHSMRACACLRLPFTAGAFASSFQTSDLQHRRVTWR